MGTSPVFYLSQASWQVALTTIECSYLRLKGNHMFRVANALFLSTLSAYSFASNDLTSSTEIEKITVQSAATANNRPVGTFDSPVSNLEYDPRVDLQSRNMAEAQADVTIRGGIFENTGFRIGSATLYDPQTGHYFAEIPIAPEMLSKPQVFTGVDNALYGVNSSVGSIAYQWNTINSGGNVSAGAGNNGFKLFRLHSAYSTQLESNRSWTLGVEGEYSHSQSDGTIEFGDHDFDRASGRVQLASEHSQTDVFYGQQEKFFGWPNMYTPFNVNETEALKTKLFMINHTQQYTNDSHFELTAYHRKHQDHYVFSRENPSMFEAFHETEVDAFALSGTHSVNSQFNLLYSAQAMADSIESTTLENNFTSRDYYKLSLVPEYTTSLDANQSLTARLGVAFDDTNRDDSHVSVIGDISWLTRNQDNSTRKFYLSYAEATQVAGYTAIGGSETGGLFRSNHDLKREVSKNIEIGMSLDALDWRFDSALFYRFDNDLTDWTYSFDATSARAANAVDIDTLGFELFAIKSFGNADIVASYTYLDKSENYFDDTVDASFYALNYPPHRVTLGAVWHLHDSVVLRIDNEWRKQQENALRNGDDNALFTHLTATYTPSQLSGVNLVFAVDNLWNEKFEEVPGTPGRGEQYSITANYTW